MIPAEYDAAIKVSAQKYILEESLIRAIIMTESSGDTWVARFEPKWRNFYQTKECAFKVNSSFETETMLQATSFGLMQVIGAVARELGHQGSILQLCVPSVGIDYGCKLLSRLRARYGNNAQTDVIAAYNAGSAIREMDGKYRNQAYVDKVLSYMAQVDPPKIPA